MSRKDKKIKTMVIISNMISTLKREFTNDLLFDEMISGLNLINSKNAKVNIISDSELIISVNHGSQLFGIKFEPSLDSFSKLTFTKSLYDGGEESVTTIDYSDGKHIIVTNNKLTKLRNNDNIILEMESSRNVNIYRYNALRYSKKYETRISMNLSGDMGSSLDEIFVSENNQAIRRIAKVNNNAETSIDYYENNNYYPLPFNTRTSNLEENIGEFIPTTKESFDDNLELFKDKTIENNRAYI